MLAPSKFNFWITSEDGDGAIAIFNAATGSLQILAGPNSTSLTAILSDAANRLSEEELGAELSWSLRSGGFLRQEGFEEVAEIRDRFWRARGATPVVITLTATMDCNLGCYYCYEQRSGASLTTADISGIVGFAQERVRASPFKALHIDWYGGEPLLNQGFIEAASRQLQKMCAAEGFVFVASIISNGTEWPDDIEDFVARHRLRQIQISFDGLQENHDRRRHFRRSYAAHRDEGSSASSFERAVAVVDALVTCARVDLRFNIDRKNQTDLIPFIRFARSRGWFVAKYPAVFQPARLAAYTGSSAFMRSSQLTLKEFDALRASVREELAGQARVEESEVPDGFPYPRTSVCAALAKHSAVVGADGLVYRCGLQVGEEGRAVGSATRPDSIITGDIGSDGQWWDGFDPTGLPTCSVCSFLPVCWGGCPKKHLDCDEHAIREQGRYWRTNLPRLIAAAAGFADYSPREFSEADQFR